MTRFLSRIFEDTRCGSFNDETERLFAYHHATKHTYHSVRSSAHDLDWKNQPNPFRIYEGAPNFALPREPGFTNAGTFATIAALAESGTAAIVSGIEGGRTLDVAWLSRLLWHSMAISAWKKAPRGPSRYSLRVNPSSGNLHPTETYLAVRGYTGVGDGLYHYRADRHALELRNSGDHVERLLHALQIPWAAESSLIIGLTSIFWREAWKYRDRAYRYCCHDLGHAMISILLAARALGLRGGAIAHFGDAHLTRTLGLAGGDEAPMAFLAFPSKGLPARGAVAPQEEFIGVANELSTEEVPYELLLEMHRATILPDTIEEPQVFANEVAGNNSHTAMLGGATNLAAVEALPEPLPDSPLGEIARRRRSALDFDPRTAPMERTDVGQILDFATRDWRADWRGNFGGPGTVYESESDLVILYLYLHRVRGCDPGVYRWEQKRRILTQLHRGNVERVAAFLSLEQTLAGNSCFTISMIADLAEAAHRFGNRGYRCAYFEAGAIGQRLYLAAEALRWNATGIGAFYDDDVHRYLGFLEEGSDPVSASLDTTENSSFVMLDSPSSRHQAAQDRKSCDAPAQVTVSEVESVPRKDARTLPRQVIYHFAVGRAIPDPRVEG